GPERSARRTGARRRMGGARRGDAGDRGGGARCPEEGGVSSIDFGYFAYLASNVPPLDIARAVAVRAKRALRRIRQVLGPVARHPALRPPFFMQVPPEQKRRRIFRGNRPSILDPSLRDLTARILRERFPEACRFVLHEAKASRRGEVAVFG